jgi:predicted amidophosphoribosyltransferase
MNLLRKSLVCPVCHNEYDKLCPSCLALIKDELFSSYLYGHCSICGSPLIHEDSICSHPTPFYHYRLFDNTIIIRTLIHSFEYLKEPHIANQIASVIVEQLPQRNLFFVHPYQDGLYSPFFTQLTDNLNSRLDSKMNYQLCSISISLQENQGGKDRVFTFI